MAEKNALQVVTISGACCMPHLAQADKKLEKCLQEAAGQLAMDIDVNKVSLSALLAGKGGLAPKQRDLVLALFQRHGAAFTPAVMIDDQMVIAGRLPTVDQLKEALQNGISRGVGAK